jgi:hypothetical protein
MHEINFIIMLRKWSHWNFKLLTNCMYELASLSVSLKSPLQNYTPYKITSHVWSFFQQVFKPKYAHTSHPSHAAKISIDFNLIDSIKQSTITWKKHFKNLLVYGVLSTILLFTPAKSQIFTTASCAQTPLTLLLLIQKSDNQISV